MRSRGQTATAGQAQGTMGKAFIFCHSYRTLSAGKIVPLFVYPTRSDVAMYSRSICDIYSRYDTL